MKKSMEDIQLSELVLRKLDGVISKDEHKKLTSQLSSSDEMIRQYNELIILYSIFSEQADTIFGGVAPEPTPYQLNNILLALASAQLEASPVQVEAEKPESESEFMDEAQPVKAERGTPKRSLLLLAPVAAVLFFVLFAYLVPVNTEREVAVLSDSIGAVWDDSTGPMEKGIRLRTGETSLFLKKGLVELLYDSEARVVIEAPAEFSMRSDYQIKVNYGRLYATVPSQAVGFTVSTPNATIVDKGTEFGVEADLWGRTELHVIKGKTMLFSGTEKDSKTRHKVNQGQAKKVTDINQVQDMSLKERVFVRRVDRNSNFIWKGQEALSLSDIVGGGNGLGTGRLNVGFDPLTGSFKTLIRGYEREGNGRYISVYNNPLIDGVLFRMKMSAVLWLLPGGIDMPLFVTRIIRPGPKFAMVSAAIPLTRNLSNGLRRVFNWMDRFTEHTTNRFWFYMATVELHLIWMQSEKCFLAWNWKRLKLHAVFRIRSGKTLTIIGTCLMSMFFWMANSVFIRNP